MRYRIAAAVLAIAGLATSGCSALVESDGRSEVHASPVGATVRASANAAAAVAVARAKTTAARARQPGCRHNDNPQLVRVSLRRQRMWLCHRHTVVRTTAITSGMSGADTRTPTGHYRIESRSRHTTLTLNTGQQFAVKYWIAFDAPLYGFHDASWQTIPYGSPKYRTHGSHGCVHVPLKAIAFLYRWAHTGTPVRIHA